MKKQIIDNPREEETIIQDALKLKHVIMYPEDDRITSLYDIVDEFRRGTLQKPPHQRTDVWDKEKKLNWINRLRGGERIVGVIVTYQLDNGTPNLSKLNDGLQRTLTTLQYLENPEKYGDDKETAEQHIRAVSMPKQHRHYKREEDALRDFQLLNVGTSLTPQEFCKGILTYMSGYKIYWESFFEELHLAINSQAQRIVRDRYTRNREDKHKYMRDNYALLYRFLSNDKTTSGRQYKNVSKKSLKFNTVNSRDVIEWYLRLKLEQLDIEQSRRQSKKFIGLIERETSLIVDIWINQLGHDPNTGISTTLYRWIIACSIWKRHNGINHESWENFLYRLIERSNGGSQLVKIDADGNAHPGTTLGLSNMSILNGICEIIGSSMYQSKNRKRKKRANNNRPGTDESHKLPLAHHGEGETIPEPAGRNRARGARPIPEE